MNRLTRSFCNYFPLFMKTIFFTYYSTLASKQLFHYHEALGGQILLRSLTLSLFLLLFHLPQKYRTFWLINILKSSINIKSLCCASGTNKELCVNYTSILKNPPKSLFSKPLEMKASVPPQNISLRLLRGSNQVEFGQDNRQVYLSINLKNPLDIHAEGQGTFP